VSPFFSVSLDDEAIAWRKPMSGLYCSASWRAFSNVSSVNAFGSGTSGFFAAEVSPLSANNEAVIENIEMSGRNRIWKFFCGSFCF